jgi:hypothetical protein
MNKFDRIKLIRDSGLNTEDNMLMTPTTDLNELLTFILRLNEVSIRVFDPISASRPTPHYPLVKICDLKKTLEDIFKNGFYAIVAKPIDPKFAELAGCIWKETDVFHKKYFTVELASGPYTVRRVTHDGIVDYRFKYPLESTSDERILKMIKTIRDAPYDNCTFEMSYYSIPVGYQSDNVIVWDITGDGTKNSIVL